MIKLQWNIGFMRLINIKRGIQDGFTIIELLVAMTAFSSMIMIVGLTTLQLGRMYYKGVSTINTQEAARTVIASVSEQLQFATGIVTQQPADLIRGTARIKSYCVGDVRFTYVLNRRLDSSLSAPGFNDTDKTMRHVLWQDRKTTNECTPLDLASQTPSTNGKDLIGEDMRLTNFSINENVVPVSPGGRSDIAKIDIGIIYGVNELINFSDAPGTENPVGCRTGDVTAQWCAQSNLTTNVFRRYPRSI